MQNDLFESNTIETLGVTPRYVLQHNAITRSAHNLSTTAKKLTAMAMALLPPDLSSLTAAFTFTEFCTALDIPKGGETFTIFKEAVKECMESVIQVETPPDKKGKTSWIMYHWFQLAEFNKDSGVCTMTFDQKLAEFLKALKWLYSKINLTDLGRLHSRYALRIYELAISYASLRGKEGNQDQSWYIERTIEELRKLFGVNPKEYKENREFRRNAIEAPIREINNAGIGIEIKTESIKKGRNLAGLRFDCKKVARNTKGKRGKKSLPLTDICTGDPRTKAEKEAEHMKERYPFEFAELYQQELGKLKSIGAGEKMRKAAAEYAAIKQLKERHGIAK